jgi:hypothetical protein
VALKVGDKLEEQARSTERTSRTGTIEEVLRGDSFPRYRIRWEVGQESVHAPAAGSLPKLAAEKKAV